MYSPCYLFLHSASRIFRKIFFKLCAIVLFLIMFAFTCLFKAVAAVYRFFTAFIAIGALLGACAVYYYAGGFHIAILGLIAVSGASVALYYLLPVIIPELDYATARIKYHATAPLFVRSRLKYTF